MLLHGCYVREHPQKGIGAAEHPNNTKKTKRKARKVE
jgi:hypothetical protein